jgi:hypothetical protein
MIQLIFNGFGQIARQVLVALLPLFLVFSFFQIFWLKLPKTQFINILKGFCFTFVGLTLFLQGVNIGFMPIGEYLGKTLGAQSYNWILIPIGCILGFVVTLAEPGVQVLNMEVEKASSGYINKKIMLYFLSIGVSIAVALAMLRILTGISIWYFIIPGYLLAFILTRYVSKTFVAIAFDSGGVTTGPMIVTFISSLAIGFSSVIQGRNPLLDGFGMISLVALTPILSVLILGYLYNRSEKAAYDKKKKS